MIRVTQAAFARLEGVNKSTVNRWVKNGRIEVDAQGLIDPEAAQRMRHATESPLPHHQARKAQFEEAGGRGMPGEGTIAPPAAAGEHGEAFDAVLTPLAHLGEQLKRATVDLQRHKAELAAMEVDKLAGTLVERSDVDFVLADAGSVFRAELESMPDHLTSELLALQGDAPAIHKTLEGWAREACQRISQQMTQRADERFETRVTA